MDCLICNSKGTVKKTSFKQSYPQGKEQDIYLEWYLCKYCKGVFCYPQPTFEQIEKYWTTVSYIKPELKDEYKELKNEIYERILYHLKKDIKTDSTVLDFGSNFGQFLDLLKQNNFNPEGYDINENAIKISKEKGFKIYEKENELNELSLKYDAVNANDVFCYVDVPYKWLKIYFNLLKNQGVLILRLTNKILFFKLFYYLIPKSKLRDKILSFILQDQFHMVSIKTLGKIGLGLGFDNYKIDIKARTAPFKNYSMTSNIVYIISLLLYYISFKQVNIIPGVLLILKKS